MMLLNCYAIAPVNHCGRRNLELGVDVPFVEAPRPPHQHQRYEHAGERHPRDDEERVLEALHPLADLVPKGGHATVLPGVLGVVHALLRLPYIHTQVIFRSPEFGVNEPAYHLNWSLFYIAQFSESFPYMSRERKRVKLAGPCYTGDVHRGDDGDDSDEAAARLRGASQQRKPGDVAEGLPGTENWRQKPGDPLEDWRLMNLAEQSRTEISGRKASNQHDAKLAISWMIGA